MVHKPCSVIVVLLVLLSSFVVAQTLPSTTPDPTPSGKSSPRGSKNSTREKPQPVWLERAEWLTLEIREDEWRLGRHQRPLLLARLAEAWWKHDNQRAKAWMESVVHELENPPQNESVQDSARRVLNAELVLTIVLPLDRSYAERLLNVVAEGLEIPMEAARSPEERRALAVVPSRLSQAVHVALENSDFDSADRLFRTLLKAKHELRNGNMSSSMLKSIRRANREHGDKLFGEALQIAKTGFYPGLIHGLADVAFPQGGNETTPPEDLRISLLNVLADAVSTPSQQEGERSRTCPLSLTAARLLKHYPPEQAAAVQVAIDSCRSTPPTVWKAHITAANMETAEEMLTAGGQDSDVRVRVSYKYLAAQRESDPVRALEVIDSMTKEERETAPTWLANRQRYEMEAVEALHKRHDYQGLQQVIDRSPARPQTLLTIAEMLFVQKDEAFARDMLSELRRTLEKTQADDPMLYLRFLNLYARLIPTETASVFKEAIVGINGIKPPSDDAAFRWSSLGADLQPARITADIIDLDPSYAAATIKLLDSFQGRAVVRLNLLHAALRRHEQDKKQQLQKRPAAVRTNRRDNVAPIR